METTTLLGFIMVSTIGIITPGPDVMLAMSNGSRCGVRRSMPGIAGVAFSDLFLMSAVAFGLGAILAASQLFFTALKLLGVAYLGYVGARLLVARPLPNTAYLGEMPLGDLQARLFTRCFFVAFTNVKVWLFFAAFLPQFIDAARPQIPQYMLLAFVFELINVAALIAYAGFGASAVHVLKGSTAVWMDRLSGIVLLLLALALIMYQRGEAS